MDRNSIKERLKLAADWVRHRHLPAWLANHPWGLRGTVGVLLLVLYYLLGSLWVNRVDTSPQLASSPAAPAPHYSRAVFAASQLTLREVVQHHWTPADPFFLPGWLLTAMPRFQQGMVAAIAKFAESVAVLDGGNDPELAQAAGLYKYPPNVWRVASGIAWLPTAPSSRQYRIAAHGLEDYTNNLARKDQPNPLQQNTGIQAVLDTAAADLTVLVDRLDRHLEGEPTIMFDYTGRDLFQSGRGHAYAWGIILAELAKDNAEVLNGHGLDGQWRRMVDLLLRAAAMDPVMVLSGGDGMLANHPAQQGFMLLRAKTLMAEIKAGLN